MASPDGRAERVDPDAMCALLNDFSAALAGELTTAGILHRLTVGLTALLDIDGAVVLTPDEFGRLTRADVATREAADELERLDEVRQEGPCQQAHVSGEIVAVDDLAGTGAWPDYRRGAVDLGLRAMTAIPLRARELALGVLALYSARPRPLGANELRTARTMANLAAACLVVAIDREATRQAQSALAHQAAHDPLTGLPTRRVFFEQLARSLANLDRHPSSLGVLFIDIDGLKRVNDTYGHAAGDQLLVICAQRIESALRPTDLLARLGGDEFVVILEQLDGAAAACAVAERIVDSLGLPQRVEDRTLQPSASVGVAVTADASDTPDLLVFRADAAMYRAKRLRRGRFELFDPVVHATERAETESGERLAAELESVLSKGELEVHYQPIVQFAPGEDVRPEDFGSRPFYAVEALLRWRHPRRGLLAASAFIDTAARTGVVVELGAWGLVTACEQLAVWDRLLGDRAPQQLFVNLSSAEVSAPGLLARVRRALDVSGLAADRLTLEITEDGPVDQPEALIEIAEGLRGLGCRLAIDEFGTGHASLGRVARIPSAVLKTDRSFSRNLPQSPESAAVVSAALLIGHNLHRTVIVEGVETREVLKALQDLGATHFQGFYLAPPQHPDALTERLLAVVPFGAGGPAAVEAGPQEA